MISIHGIRTLRHTQTPAHLERVTTAHMLHLDVSMSCYINVYEYLQTSQGRGRFSGRRWTLHVNQKSCETCGVEEAFILCIYCEGQEHHVVYMILYALRK